jgi:hypothetical protein
LPESEKVEHTKGGKKHKTGRKDPGELIDAAVGDEANPLAVSFSWHQLALEEGKQFPINPLLGRLWLRGSGIEIPADVVLGIERDKVLKHSDQREPAGTARIDHAQLSIDGANLRNGGGDVSGKKSSHQSGVQHNSQDRAHDDHLKVHAND